MYMIVVLYSIVVKLRQSIVCSAWSSFYSGKMYNFYIYGFRLDLDMLYHTMSGISLLLHDAKAKLRQSVNNNDIPQV